LEAIVVFLTGSAFAGSSLPPLAVIRPEVAVEGFDSDVVTVVPALEAVSPAPTVFLIVAFNPVWTVDERLPFSSGLADAV
jgi:hypothetical protein